jgi:glycosyltransferase involved in cell wall biosynthesis
MRILIFTRYGRQGASSRIRFYQYLPYLKAQGVDVTVAPLLGDDYVHALYAGGRKRSATILGAYFRRAGHLRGSRRFDLVWIEKELFPLLPAWGERWLNRLSVPYVADFDDAIFHNYDQHRRPAVRRLLGGKIGEVMRRSILVVAGNGYLADHARQAGAERVEYLPTVVDLDRYPAAPPSAGRTFTVGWVGTPLTARYVRAVRPALADLCLRDGAHVVLVGAGEQTMAGVPLETPAWSEETEAAQIRRFDVGIMPLPDAPFERGKCGYKLIQYMACGRPVVASPVGVNRQIVREGVNGFLAATPADWVRALSALREDRARRARMGEEARKTVEREYCLQVTAPRLLALLRGAAAGKR